MVKLLKLIVLFLANNFEGLLAIYMTQKISLDIFVKLEHVVTSMDKNIS